MGAQSEQCVDNLMHTLLARNGGRLEVELSIGFVYRVQLDSFATIQYAAAR
jgi:hypothetical protein